MPKPNTNNERAKRDYTRYLREARGRNEKTIDKAAAAIAGFESFTSGKDFKSFCSEQAESFKHHLCSRISKRTGKPLSYSTVLHKLQDLRAFFRWLPTRQGYKSLSADDADYFNLSARETRIAYAPKEKRVPTMEEAIHALRCAPATTDVDLRDRALVACTLLTGARDGAIASLKLKHVDMVEGRLLQPAREVNTKAAKTMKTCFFPVPAEVVQILGTWVHHLKLKGFGPEDPLFPSTCTGLVLGRFAAVGLSRSNWATTTPIRRIFKTAFERAGLPYFNPHSLRSTLAVLGQQRCRTAEQLKVWSQNLGHDNLLTTLHSYGTIGAARQREIMRQFTTTATEPPAGNIDLAMLKDAFELIFGRHGSPI